MAVAATPWSALVRVGLFSLLLLIGFGVLLPIFPLWVARFAGTHAGVGLATTGAVGVGLVAARVVAGRLMEGRSRLPVLLAGLALSVASALVFPALGSMSAVLVVRFVQGVGFGLAMTAGPALITDLAPPERRGQILGYYGAGNAIAFLVGPALGALVVRRWSYDAAFYCAGGLSACALLCVPGLRGLPHVAAATGPRGLLEPLRDPRLRRILGAHFTAILLHGVVLAFLPLRMKGHEGWMRIELFFAVEAATVIALRVLVGHRFDALGRRPFVLGGLIALALSGLALGTGGPDAMYLLGAVLYGVGFGAYGPSMMALTGDVLPERLRARGFALFLLAFDLGFTAGGGIFGPVADLAGVPASFYVAALMPVVAFGLMARRSSPTASGAGT